MKDQWNDKILDTGAAGFDQVALDVFRFQYANNPVYRQYTDALGIHPSGIDNISHIPFLPIRFFKSHPIQTGYFEPELVFESSGTTGIATSRHCIREAGLYRQSFNKAFEQFYGHPQNWCIIGLLPSYLERKNSSLVFMVNDLVSQSAHPASGFYLDDFKKLEAVLKELERQKQKTLLIGVTFALLDFAEKYPLPLQHTTVMETGGMKGRREELVRPQVHQVLKEAFGLPVIHSEYGMTELLSQAYSAGEGIFECPSWMRIMIRDEEDPFEVTGAHHGKTASGAINIIDLANVYSCSFIATDDAGRLFANGSFEVIGRMDNSDLRGCSLLAI